MPDGSIETLKASIISQNSMKDYLRPPHYPSKAKIIVWATRYLASPSVPDVSPIVANLIFFILIRGGCWRGYNMRGNRREPIFCHLPEAGMHLNPKEHIKSIETVGRMFTSTYAHALKQDRFYGLYHWMNTQNVKDIYSGIVSNQHSIIFMPGLSSPSEIGWIEEGAGVVFDKYKINYILQQIGDMEENRGKALFISGDIQKISTRPRITYHIEEHENFLEMLRRYREEYGLSYAEPWVRWDAK